MPESIDEEIDAWEHMPGEPAIWYTRFHHFLLLGSTRTIRSAWVLTYREKHKGVSPGHLGTPSSWYTTAYQWWWKERASEYDAEQLRILQSEDQEARIEARRQRRDLLGEASNEVFRRVVEDLPNIEYVSWKDTMTAVDLVTRGLRDEYNDRPTNRVESNVNLKFVEQFTEAMAQAFMSVNDISDPNERQKQFAKALLELTSGNAPVIDVASSVVE